MKRVLAVCAVAALAGGAQAGVALYSGDTTGGPTWNRPVSLGSLSAVGTAVPYEVMQVNVDANGSYDFLGEWDYPPYDGFMLLYQNSFDPNDQLTNLVALDDDGTGLDNSMFSALLSGIDYFIVATGFANDDFGTYTITVSGQGNITFGGGGGPVVPLPSAAGMGLVGLGLVGLKRRR